MRKEIEGLEHHAHPGAQLRQVDPRAGDRLPAAPRSRRSGRRSSPFTHRISVLLPEPDGPHTTTTSPAATSRSMSRSTCSLPKCLLTPRNSDGRARPPSSYPITIRTSPGVHCLARPARGSPSPCPRRPAELVLHLHGLDDDQGVAGLHGVARRSPHAADLGRACGAFRVWPRRAGGRPAPGADDVARLLLDAGSRTSRPPPPRGRRPSASATSATYETPSTSSEQMPLGGAAARPRPIRARRSPRDSGRRRPVTSTTRVSPADAGHVLHRLLSAESTSGPDAAWPPPRSPSAPRARRCSRAAAGRQRRRARAVGGAGRRRAYRPGRRR